ncbi:MAG: GTP-binding protein [Candidatus Hydrothermarchaeota archaeon]
MTANIAVVGHVDHGKSTLIGRLLYDSQNIKDKKIEEIQKIAQQYKKKFEFAYLLDSLEEEVKEEKTIDTTQVIFKGKNYYTIIDAPGHKKFLKNMLTGASYANAGVLVVSASQGVREQTRRHLFLLHFLRIKKIFICINKMDILDYRKDFFEKTKKELTELLTSLNCNSEIIPFIPISALKGDNIYHKSEKMAWYEGLTLIQALDENIKLEEKDSSLSRFVVQDTYRVGGERIIVGRVEAGTLRQEDEVVFSPSGLRTKIKEIKVFGEKITQVSESDSIGLILKEDSKVGRGEVCGLADSPPIARRSFSGEMFLLSGKLQENESLLIKCATNKVRGKISKIIKKIDSETVKEIHTDSQRLNPNEAACVEFKLSEPIVVEQYSQVPALGRFILEKNHKNIAAGIILEKIKDESRKIKGKK